MVRADAGESSRRDHHSDGDFPAQRQHGGDAGDRQDQRQPAPSWPTGKKVRYLNVNDKLADQDGKLFDGMMNADKLHPTLRGYQVWADALKPIFTELLGPPAPKITRPRPPAIPAPAAELSAQARRSTGSSNCSASPSPTGDSVP